MRARSSAIVDGMQKSLWNAWFGPRMTWKLQQRIVPQLRWNQEVWGETVGQYLQRPVRWLDAGCGWRLLGEDLEPLENELVRRARMVVGADCDLAHLGKHLNLSHRVGASLESLPFPDASFDLVTCNMVFEHLVAPRETLRELSRVVVPGGTIMVHTPNTRNYLVSANILAKKVLPRSLILKLVFDDRLEDDIYPTHYRANKVSTLKTLGNSLDLRTKYFRLLTHPRPYTRFFAPLAFFELLLMRATMKPPFDRFGTTIVIIFEKPPAPASDAGLAA